MVYKGETGWNYMGGRGSVQGWTGLELHGRWMSCMGGRASQLVRWMGKVSAKANKQCWFLLCSQQTKWWKKMCEMHITCTTRTAIWDNTEKLYKSVDTRYWSVIFRHLSVFQMIQFMFVHWNTDEHIRINYTTISVDLIHMSVCSDRVLIWTDWLTYTSKYGLQLHRRANVYVNIY